MQTPGKYALSLLLLMITGLLIWWYNRMHPYTAHCPALLNMATSSSVIPLNCMDPAEGLISVPMV